MVLGFNIKLILLITSSITLLTMDEEKIIMDIVKENNNGGVSITELVKLSSMSRSAVRTILAKLEGAGNLGFRQVGMAKLYRLKNEKIKY